MKAKTCKSVAMKYEHEMKNSTINWLVHWVIRLKSVFDAIEQWINNKLTWWLIDCLRTVFSLFSDKFIAHKNPVNHDFCPNSPHSIFGINFCPGGKRASEKKNCRQRVGDSNEIFSSMAQHPFFPKTNTWSNGRVWCAIHTQNWWKAAWLCLNTITPNARIHPTNASTHRYPALLPIQQFKWTHETNTYNR